MVENVCHIRRRHYDFEVSGLGTITIRVQIPRFCILISSSQDIHFSTVLNLI